MKSNRYDQRITGNRVAIPARYWKSNFEAVKEMQLQEEVYVYEKSQKIQGFIGVNGND